jgi:hypothetical protein
MHTLLSKVLLLHCPSAITYASQASIFRNMVGRTLSSGIAQWDPVVDFKLLRLLDGSFKCAGVKNRTTTSCGFRIEGEKAKEISQIVDTISLLAPQWSIASLESLAKSSLCHHHKLQIGVKVTAWTRIVLQYPVAAVRALTTSETSTIVHENQTEITLPLCHELEASSETSAQLPRPLYDGARHSSTEQIESLLIGMKQLQATTAYLETRLEEAMTDTSLWKQSEPRTRRIGCLASLFRKHRTKGK